MKILTISDEECPALWDYYVPGKLQEYDLIISCGDLKPEYLSFLVTMAKCPVLYVHGNHDAHYDDRPPEGCDCIDDRLVEFAGLRILGLGGCRRYHPGKHQFTDEEMRRRIKKLQRHVRKAGGVDIVVTHAPPRGVGDGDDNAHRGFDAFLELMETWHPPYLLHGHVHLSYGADLTRERRFAETTVVNTCQRYVLELPDPEQKSRTLRYLTPRKKHWFFSADPDDTPWG